MIVVNIFLYIKNIFQHALVSINVRIVMRSYAQFLFKLIGFKKISHFANCMRWVMRRLINKDASNVVRKMRLNHKIRRENKRNCILLHFLINVHLNEDATWGS